MEQLNMVETETVSAKGLGNYESLAKDIQNDILGADNSDGDLDLPPLEEVQVEFPLTNEVKVEPIDEDIPTKPEQSSNDPGSDLADTFENLDVKGNSSEDPSSRMKEIFPRLNEKSSKIYKLPEFRCCIVEHNYSKFTNPGFGPSRMRVQTSTCFSMQSENTLKFENKPELIEKRMEQPTIVVQNSITKHDESNSDLSKSDDSIKERLRKKPASNTAESNLNNSPDVANTEENKPVKFLTPKIRIRRSSKGRGDCYDIIVEEDTSMPPPSKIPRLSSPNLSREPKKFQKRNYESKAKRKLDERKTTVNVGEITGKVAKMEKIIQARNEALAKSNEKTTEFTVSKNNENTPLKMKTVCNKNVETPNEGGYALPTPNSTKTAPGDKNWNLEYVEDDVRNLGLDDLLLRASELNAENFTKALGQNSGGRNGNKSDSPDIVLSFPSAKRESDDPLNSDNPNGGNIKKAKLDIQKKSVQDDELKTPTEEEAPKKVPELPKRPGLKVKTVQNINEEFKDSLGAKLKNLEGRDILPENPIPVYTINDDIQNCNQTAEVFIPDGRDNIPEAQPAILSCRKVIRQQDPLKNINEMSEETRPFIMTIIQNKDNPAKDRIPASLTPKVFVKPKTVLTDPKKLVPAMEDRQNDGGINKIAQGQGPKSGENVTLFVSEPRSFEVVNVEGYSDPSLKKVGRNSHFVLNYATLSKKDLEGKNLQTTGDNLPKRRTIPILLNSKKKYLRMPLPNGQKFLVSPAEAPNKGIIMSPPRPQNRVVNSSLEGPSNIQRENNPGEKVNQTAPNNEVRVIQKDPVPAQRVARYVHVIPRVASPNNVIVRENPPRGEIRHIWGGESLTPQPKEQIMTLTAFSNVLKDILPDKWILSLDKKFGLQIIKTHLDEYLNPSIMISVVVGRTGKVTVNVRGRQLEKSHDLFTNICEVGTNNERISVNYILAIINKLRFFNVCFGCDDLSLKKYWCEDGFIEYYTEFQQTYRSHICESLVRLGRKRCHPCYRMHESLKKRRRREQLSKKAESESNSNPNSNANANSNYARPGTSSMSNNHQGKGAKRNWEEFLEESFMRMKRMIESEIERAREEEENERVPRTQDEVLGSMGLTRRDALDVNLRKSKREKKGFKQCESLLTTDVNKEELYFLDKYWQEITELYTTSLLVGAYSRTSMGRLKEKCKTFYKILATWRKIIRDNPIWVGGYINLAENLVTDGEEFNSAAVEKRFEKMDSPAMRAYVINCVKEINRMKNRLRTKNKTFRVLYNTFLKPNLKRGRQSTDVAGWSDVNMDLAEEKDLPQEESTPEKTEECKLSTSTEIESSDENSHHSGGAAPGASDGD